MCIFADAKSNFPNIHVLDATFVIVLCLVTRYYLFLSIYGCMQLIYLGSATLCLTSDVLIGSSTPLFVLHVLTMCQLKSNCISNALSILSSLVFG